VSDGLKFLRTTAWLNIASTSDFGGGVIKAADARRADAFMLDRIGIAVVNAPPDQLNFIRAAVDTGPVRRITRERYVHIASSGVGAAMRPSGTAGSISEYVAGYRDGVDGLAEALVGGRTEAVPRSATLGIELPPETEWTWGLQVTGVSQSRYSGKGIKVAVLDTGIDLDHPDFAGRAIASQSFVANFLDAHDGHGHGTHCLGTACGPQRPGTVPRYGIAYEADVYVGKVLNDAGSGVDFDILAGINWALEQGCQIVSISIGKSVGPDEPFVQLFEDIAKQALDDGLVIFAAAGNGSSRPFDVSPAIHPANCPSIWAVAALDPHLGVAPFSNGSGNIVGGEINIAGPGVNVRSSWPKPVLYNTESGTSMATPHVAGIAALFAEATGLRGKALVDKVFGAARNLGAPRGDIGAGLVQSP
jgi:subtilisin